MLSYVISLLYNIYIIYLHYITWHSLHISLNMWDMDTTSCSYDPNLILNNKSTWCHFLQKNYFWRQSNLSRSVNKSYFKNKILTQVFCANFPLMIFWVTKGWFDNYSTFLFLSPSPTSLSDFHIFVITVNCALFSSHRNLIHKYYHYTLITGQNCCW